MLSNIDETPQPPIPDPEEIERERQRRQDRLQALGNSLQRKLKDHIGQRAAIETRWLADLRQYHGRYEATLEATMKDPDYGRSQVFANITRAKTNAAESRISDMLFPADDRNWMIQPTPVPEWDTAARQGNAEAQTLKDSAEQRAEAMQREIDDQLTESRYNIEARRMIHQAAVLGTGILKGPVIVNRTRKAWRQLSDHQGQTVQVLEIVAETRPAVEWVDLWNFYPDLSVKSIEDCDGIFERKFLSARRMRELIDRPGFLREPIIEALRQGPAKFSQTIDHLEKLRSISGITGVKDEHHYEVWEYHGPIDPDDLRACGVEVGETADRPDLEGTVIFVGDAVIFADLNPMETQERPYSVWTWEEDEACLFGYGVPYLMRTPQEVMNSAWRMMMDNASVCAGPQVVLKRQKIRPADGVWKITPMKLWESEDDALPVSDTFTTFDFNSHQPEIGNILTLAKTFADEETNLPLIAQGSLGPLPQNAPATTTSIMMNAANTTLRRMVKLFDDDVTKTMITRFYDWNMQFSPDERIKGDFHVDARGSSALMVKELQSQQLMQFAQFYGHPAFAAILAPKAAPLLRRVAESMRISADEVVPTDDEIAQMQQQTTQTAQQQQPDDPRLQTAMIRAQTELKRAELQAAANAQDMEFRARMAQQDQAAKAAELNLLREIEMMKLASTQKLTLEQIRSQLAQTAIKERSKQQLFSVERKLKLSQGSGI
jgi:hypothetical protein